jgi:hypothetical protein
MMAGLYPTAAFAGCDANPDFPRIGEHQAALCAQRSAGHGLMLAPGHTGRYSAEHLSRVIHS